MDTHGKTRADYANAVTWPYLAREVDQSLDPDLIEKQAQEILARAVTNGRLVAFLGSGISMAYGRLSWGDLVRAVLHEIDRIDLRQCSDPQRGGKLASRLATIRVRLGLERGTDEKTLKKKLRGSNPLLVLQLFREVLDLAAEDAGLAGSDPIKKVTKIFEDCLGSPRCHDELFDQAWRGVPPAAGAVDLIRRNGKASAFTGYLDTELKPWAAANPHADQPPRRYFLHMLAAPEAAGIRNASQHSNGHHSPISLLLHDFGVRRFATTNYDKEIEHALKEAERHTPIEQSTASAGLGPRDNPANLHCESFDLNAGSTGRAIAFAVEGRRRHAAVLHLHGSLNAPKDMIISERDYQERYLAASKSRDLLDNAIRALFGANPILYVGSGMSEDDVLRPLREFMSMAPRRADRLGVALLPATGKPADLAMAKIDNLVRYGIHVIHYGYESQATSDPSWLCRFNEVTTTLKDKIEAGEKTALPPLALPAQMEGKAFHFAAKQGDDGEQSQALAVDIRHEVGLLNALMADTNASADAIPPDARRAAMLLIDEIQGSVVSAFLCARLMREDRFRNANWAEKATVLIGQHPGKAEPRPAQPGSGPQVYYCMHVDLEAFGDQAGNRFRDRPQRDSRWAELLSHLDQHEKFIKCLDPQEAGHKGRRWLLLTMPRGAGKGSLADLINAPYKAEAQDHALNQLMHSLTKDLPDAATYERVGLVNLSYLSDVSNIVAILARCILPVGARESTSDDVSEKLDHALSERCRLSALAPQKRVLMVMANVGVLFDGKGDAKNGQVKRFVQLLKDERYAAACIDFVLLSDEAYVPADFRIRRKEPAEARPARAETWLRPDHSNIARLLRLGIAPTNAESPNVHVYAPDPCKASEVAQPFYPEEVRRNEALVRSLEDLNRVVGGSRIALTLIYALSVEDCRQEDGLDAQERAEVLRQYFDRIKVSISSRAHESAPETAIQHVLDSWALRHLRTAQAVGDPTVDKILQGSGQAIGLQCWRGPSGKKRLWAFSLEILWHLAVFSHPVELAVLARCPDIEKMARDHIREEIQDAKLATPPQEAQIKQAIHDRILCVVELCVYRCLAIRQSARSLEGQHSSLCQHPDQKRYTVHRMVQRSFIRMMGGRDIEGIEWDQFSTSMYASQPDETPALSDKAHSKISELIRALVQYESVAPPAVADAREELQALRAAYFVARSTYSVGVLSHIALRASGSPSVPTFGYMEEYRRLVRWITHRAQTVQDKLREDPQADAVQCFYDGELVWLYAECGVVSLTQGKLEDAESLLNMALKAASRIERDDTGPLHVRLQLHIALTRIERGRPRAAKRMLEIIAQRKDEHVIPPLIAEFYLGIIEQLGGDYHSASYRYQKALDGFREHDRTRATAFVLKFQADLEGARSADKIEKAIELAQQAISVAQRGGHEDVRMLAILTLVRLRTKSRHAGHSTDSHRLLELVQQYAHDMGMPRIKAMVHEVRATLLLSQGETTWAAREATISAEVAALYDLKLFKAKALLTLARIYKLRHEPEQCKDLIRIGTEMANACEYFSCVRSFRQLDATLEHDLGDHSEAMSSDTPQI